MPKPSPGAFSRKAKSSPKVISAAGVVKKCPKCGGDHTKIPAEPACQLAIRMAAREGGKLTEEIATALTVAPDPKAKKKKPEFKPSDFVPAPDKLDFKSDVREQPQDLSELTQVAQCAGKMLKLEEDIANLQVQLQEKATELDKIQTQDLPELMASFNLEEFKLSSGQKIKIKRILRGGIPSLSAIEKEKDEVVQEEMKKRRADCFKFLKANGADALIKTYVEADLGKNADAAADKAIEALKKLGIAAKKDISVHSQTLLAWIRERIEAGKKLDFKLFSIFDGKAAIIERPKVKK